MGNPRCKWVRDRLPLLAGDDLRGLDRRKVERHLIDCPVCRHQRAALDQALGVLHAVSAGTPARSDAPSLWPALERQIRESRRPARPSFFGFTSGSVAWPRRLELRPAGLGLGLVTAAAVLGLGIAVVAVGGRRQRDDARTQVTRNVTPIAPPAVLTASVPPASVPDPSHEAASSQAEPPGAPESVPATRLGYDLDHTMPMGVEGREGKQPTY